MLWYFIVNCVCKWIDPGVCTIHRDLPIFKCRSATKSIIPVTRIIRHHKVSPYLASGIDKYHEAIGIHMWTNMFKGASSYNGGNHHENLRLRCWLLTRSCPLVIELVWKVRMGLGRPGPSLGPGPCGLKVNLWGCGSAHFNKSGGLAGPMGIPGRPTP